MNQTHKDAAWMGLYDALRLFPFSLAVGVCSGFGILGGCITALTSVLFGLLFGCAFLPSWLTLLPVYMLAFRFGAGSAAGAVALGGLFAFFLSLLPDKTLQKLHTPTLDSGFLLAAAFTTTALQTTNYFGIGAVGGTVREIIADYVSLGFHGNWRGVLYGTITLVVMITYPRKFKTFHKKVSAAFFSILLTFPMNLLLVPDARHTPINEIGGFRFSDMFQNVFFRQGVPKEAVLPMLCGGLALAVLMIQNQNRRSRFAVSTASLGTGVLGGVPLQTDGTPRSPISAVVCLVVTCGLYLCPALSRVPIHTLAVILIVAGWQGVDWGSIKTSFTGGVLSILMWVVAIAATILLGVHYAVPLLAIIALIQNSVQKKKA